MDFRVWKEEKRWKSLDSINLPPLHPSRLAGEVDTYSIYSTAIVLKRLGILSVFDLLEGFVSTLVEFGRSKVGVCPEQSGSLDGAKCPVPPSFNQLDIVSFIRIVVTVFILAEVFEQIFLVLDLGDADEHFPVSDLTVLQETLVGIEGGRLLALLVLHQFEGRDIALALCDVNIQAVTREPEQQLPTLGQVLPAQFKCM